MRQLIDFLHIVGVLCIFAGGLTAFLNGPIHAVPILIMGATVGVLNLHFCTMRRL